MKRVLPLAVAILAAAACDHDPASPVAPNVLAAPPAAPKGGPSFALTNSATATVLGLPPGFTAARAWGVNASGLAAGSAIPTEPDEDDIERAVLWDAMDVGVLPLPDGATGAEAREVNAYGTVVGYMNSGAGLRPLRWRPTGGGAGATATYAVDVLPIAGYVGGEASDINASGVIVGTVTDDGGRKYAARWVNGALDVLDGVLPTGFNLADSYATAVNDAGQIAGYVEGIGDDAGTMQAFRWQSELNTGRGVFTGLGYIETNPYTQNQTVATGINASGAVTGHGTVPQRSFNGQTWTRAFRWTAEGGIMGLSPLPGGTDAQGQEITDDGQVVGHSEMDHVRTAVVWSPSGVVREIPGPNGDGVVSAVAFGANASGTVVGGAGDEEDSKAIRWQIELNRAPTADAGGPYTVNEGSPLTLDGTKSADPDGDPLHYAWTFGDGGTAATEQAEHTYADDKDGGYTATLTVRDRDGGVSQKSDDASAAVTVNNVAPTVTANGEQEAVINRTFTLNGEFTDPGTRDNPWTYKVDWGDNVTTTQSNVAAQGNAVFGTHKYTTAGDYTVRITVTDKDGGVGTATVALRVRPAGRPLAEFDVTTADPDRVEGRDIAFSAERSSDTDGDLIVAYHWNFGDGAGFAVLGKTPTHKYVDNGTYTVKLVVDDGVDGKSDTATRTIRIVNAAPAFTAFAPTAQTLTGRAYTLTTEFDDPGKNDGPWSWLATWGVGSASTATTRSIMPGTVTRTYTYKEPGTRFIGVTVRDKDGASVHREQALTVVQNQPPSPTIAPPTTVREGQSVRFTAQANDPDDTDSLSYAWSFGNGRTGSGERSSSTTYADGAAESASGTNYTVKVTATDPSKATGSATALVNVVNVRPTASLSTPTVYEGSTFQLRASVSDSGTGDRPTLQARFDCGNGYVDPWIAAGAGSASLTCPAKPDGMTDTVRVQVRDKDGGERSYWRSLTVRNVTPVVVLGTPAFTLSGRTVTVHATFTDPGADNPWRWTITWGDGTTTTGTQSATGALVTSSGAAPSKTYTAAALRTVTITVRDDVATSSAKSFTVDVP